MANYDKDRPPDTRVIFLDATYTDNIDQSPLARARFSFNVNGLILPPYPSATEAPVRITRSGVPMTFTEGPAIEIRRGDRTEIEIGVTLRVFGVRRPPTSREEAEVTDYSRGKHVEISISNSHANTDSNFEGVHSVSTRNPLQITDYSGRTSHEISLTVRYRIDTINNP
jgi:hypothetical protein